MIRQRPSWTTSTPPDVRSPSKERTLWTTWVTGIIALLGILLGVQSFHGGHLGALAEYDDGVYFDAAIALVHGIAPYQHFVLLQPPLITVWLAPWAAIGSVTSQAFGFELARLATDVVSLASVLLVAFLTRRRGLTSSVVATATTALSIGTIHASQTVLIEPYLVVMCLGGLLTLGIGQHRGPSSARVVFAGALFGLAGATKVWAIIPVAVLLWRMPDATPTKRVRFAVGVALGFLLGAGPFLLLAPRRAVIDFVITQAIRGPSGMDLPARMADLAGSHLLVLLAELRSPLGALTAVIVVLAGVVVVVRAMRGHTAHLGTYEEDRLLRTLAVVVGLILVATPAYYYHYSAFFAPFLGLSLSTLGRPTPLAPTSETNPSRSTGAKQGFLTRAFVVVLVAGYLLGDVVGVIHPVVENQSVPSRPVAHVGAGCVVSDVPSFEILNDITTIARPSCPHIADWLGVERVMVHGLSGAPQDATSPAFQREVLHWFGSARTIILAPIDAGIGKAARAYLDSHFTLSSTHPDGLSIFSRRSSPRR